MCPGPPTSPLQCAPSQPRCCRGLLTLWGAWVHLNCSLGAAGTGIQGTRGAAVGPGLTEQDSVQMGATAQGKDTPPGTTTTPRSLQVGTPQPHFGAGGIGAHRHSCQHLSAASDESARLQPHNLYSLIQRAGGATGRPIPPAGRGLEVMKFVNGECLQLGRAAALRGGGRLGLGRLGLPSIARSSSSISTAVQRAAQRNRRHLTCSTCYQLRLISPCQSSRRR